MMDPELLKAFSILKEQGEIILKRLDGPNYRWMAGALEQIEEVYGYVEEDAHTQKRF